MFLSKHLRRLAKASISGRKQKSLNMLIQQLGSMFKTEKNKSLLSSVFQVLPLYFSQNYLDMFRKSKGIQKYVEYIDNRIPDQKKFAQIQRQYLKENYEKKVISCENAVYLEAYMHWLINQCSEFNIQNNDFLMEYIHLSNPRKLFAPAKAESRQKRTFIYHHGPTNSGKSTSAIQQLKDLSIKQKGIYMAPLRLLAWEYQKKLGNCTLITGQQKQYKNSNLISCTIQAANLNEQYSVAVVDEIQMIADKQRGWEWTKVVLTLKAKRIHLCGDGRAIGIISKLLEQSGDVLQERRYSRLSKLMLVHKNFELKKIEQGDCIINFSFSKLIKHRKQVNMIVSEQKKIKEEQNKSKSKYDSYKIFSQNKTPPSVEPLIKEDTQIKISQAQAIKNYAAIVYGKLPPACRRQQAVCFNQRKLPFLVATNAIGMGLNLNIKKIIFMTLETPLINGITRQLKDHQIQQIAGRAGRGKQTGFVQCVDKQILKRVKTALSTVNQNYGIKLQNINDDTGDFISLEHQIVQKNRGKIVTKQVFNPLLGRNMRESEYQIEKACFYFTNNYLLECKMRMSWIMGLNFAILDLIHFLKTYSKLNELYIYQDTTHLSYLVEVLQKSEFDLRELLTFYRGLSLSASREIKSQSDIKVRRAHKEFIQNFIKYRKVPLPGFLVWLYRFQDEQYQYMNQLPQLQTYYQLLETYVWLWNKYEFAFYEIALAKEIKLFLQKKISKILQANKFKPEKAKEEQQKVQIMTNKEVEVDQLKFR